MADKKEKTEHEYIIPLREKVRPAVRYKKTPKAIKSVKQFIARHMRIYDKDLNKIKLDKYVNEYLWARGIKNPPHKIKVKAVKNLDGTVMVELVDLPDKLKFKKLREEKVSKEALAKIESKKGLKERMQEQVKGAVHGKKKDEKAEDKKVSEDKDQDGVDDKVEEKEKIESVKDSGEKMEKDLAKKEKHTTKVKTGKAKLGEKKEYNQTSQHK
jgi:large subunit ribosomal protein L31e